MDGIAWVCLVIAVLVPILGGLVSQHLGFGPLPGAIVAVAVMVWLTRVFRVS